MDPNKIQALLAAKLAEGGQDGPSGDGVSGLQALLAQHIARSNENERRGEAWSHPVVPSRWSSSWETVEGNLGEAAHTALRKQDDAPGRCTLEFEFEAGQEATVRGLALSCNARHVELYLGGRYEDTFKGEAKTGVPGTPMFEFNVDLGDKAAPCQNGSMRLVSIQGEDKHKVVLSKLCLSAVGPGLTTGSLPDAVSKPKVSDINRETSQHLGGGSEEPLTAIMSKLDQMTTSFNSVLSRMAQLEARMDKLEEAQNKQGDKQP